MANSFDQILLGLVTPEARRLGAKLSLAWVFRLGRTWEFHYQGFCWHGRADSAYHARYQGWQAWINQQTKETAS